MAQLFDDVATEAGMRHEAGQIALVTGRPVDDVINALQIAFSDREQDVLDRMGDDDSAQV